ncbi:MAG: AbrB/MazE/SpoVT family DNA-binding domain-containing protein [Candidatus Obscuribacterales bacterium]|nr:AbrB/MazE/SpoVT family DNA-binding domain-containing protein [Candidatus Obscuribacterales bacterium]
MQDFRAKITENGRLLIPAVLRKELDLRPGDEVLLRIQDDELRIGSLKSALKQSRKLVKKYIKTNVSLSTSLIRDRRSEAEND